MHRYRRLESRDAGIGRDKAHEVNMKQTVLDPNRS